MRLIKYVLLVTVTVMAIVYVDVQINTMFSEPKILVFEKIYESVKNVLK